MPKTWREFNPRPWLSSLPLPVHDCDKEVKAIMATELIGLIPKMQMVGGTLPRHRHVMDVALSLRL